VIKADILLDSINSSGNRITTWLLTYNRFIHSELNTHRSFSRNASSSRAIPLKKMIEAVKNDPAMPVFWGKNQSGMQASVELDNTTTSELRSVLNFDGITGAHLEVSPLTAAKIDWLDARDKAVEVAERLEKLGLHKQLSSRLLEPFAHITVVLTATDMENFFSLRAREAAQPEFQKLAYLMLGAYNASKPTPLATGEWHIPFGDRMPDGLSPSEKLKVATARCARTSYLTFDGEINVQKDFELHDQLAASGHWSPFEHCAKALWSDNSSGNFRGWEQYRKQFFDENRKDERVVKK
jgi:thymidylate synthase ThyX